MQVTVSFSHAADIGDGLILLPQRNLVTGSADFAKVFGAPTSLEEDLLVLASAVYAADLAHLRDTGIRFCRDFRLTVPVVNLQALERVKADLQRLLYFLSYDNWDISFLQRGGVPEPSQEWPASVGKTLLFSGGLDSFAAAVDLIEAQETAVFVSHVTHNLTVQRSQQALYGHLRERYRDVPEHVAIRVGGRSRGSLAFPKDREESQRTRSFLFLVLAALVARRSGHRRIVLIAENGQMAIHLPLSAGRIGGFSTHTAHPRFVREMQEFLSSVLGFDLSISNPFLYQTKAKVIRGVVAEHSSAVPLAISCWRASRVRGGKDHCGVCIPCLVRRIAIEYNGLLLEEYDRDVLAEDIAALDEDDLAKRNFVDLAEFISRFAANRTADQLLTDYPELAEDSVDMDRAVKMYRRFANEALTVLRRYDGARGLLR